MGTELTLLEWLSQEPLASEIKTNDDGSRYLPIEVIKPKLDYLCGGKWETLNFNHNFFNMPDRRLFCSGNIELRVMYTVWDDFKKEYDHVNRIITGSATFDCPRYYPNENYGAICQSLSIVNASQNIGAFFGKDLNKARLTTPSESKDVFKVILTPENDRMRNTIRNISNKKL